MGKGNISVKENASFGVAEAPGVFSTYTHIDARTEDSSITIGKDSHLNNNAALIAVHANIHIGDHVLIGANLQCYTTDFHALNPLERDNEKLQKYGDICIGDNVFIGNNVTILKNVTIGNGCTIGIGSVVTKSFPPYCLIAGNPAKLVKQLDQKIFQ